MLKVEGLRAYYGKALAVSDVTLDVRPREIVCLIGNNGAGKSTTLMSICGIIRSKSGRIEFEGQEISSWPAHRIFQQGIAQVPEGRRIFPNLTVEENLRMGGFFLPARQMKERMDAVFSLFPVLSERRRQRGGSLSGGEQQMLAIGRAIIGQPKLLLLDEPSLGLAPKVIDAIYDSITALRREGMTILLVEQNARLALDVSDRAYVMDLGRIVLAGESAEMKADDRVQLAYLGSVGSSSAG
ncbi:MAG: ABC transporter ATP-binding protein [Alicyclobacillus sp.]|nr:ABC transporter ATP-binding protein [Alicyclobacillus sp.]